MIDERQLKSVLKRILSSSSFFFTPKVGFEVCMSSYKAKLLHRIRLIFYFLNRQDELFVWILFLFFVPVWLKYVSSILLFHINTLLILCLTNNSLSKSFENRAKSANSPFNWDKSYQLCRVCESGLDCKSIRPNNCELETKIPRSISVSKAPWRQNTNSIIVVDVAFHPLPIIACPKLKIRLKNSRALWLFFDGTFISNPLRIDQIIPDMLNL